jgi:hypothetical protein
LQGNLKFRSYIVILKSASSPQITRVLEQVSYLVPPSHGTGRNDTNSLPIPQISQATNDRTYARLLETTQFVLDVMNCVVPSGSPKEKKDSHNLFPGGDGWKSTIRVRLLHAVARRRILESGGRKGYNRERDGIPINQEDLAVT